MKAIAGPDTVVLRTPVPLAGENLRTVAEFTVHAEERVPFSLGYAPSHLRLPPAREPLSMLARTENHWLEWSSRLPGPGLLRRCGAALADHAEGARLRADRRHRGRAHHLAARAHRRHSQLGLPLLLAARRHHHPAGADARRLLRRGARLACLAGPRDGRLARADPDHVRHRRRAAPARDGARLAARLPGFEAGADRQQRRQPAAARRIRRGDGRAAPGPRGRAAGRRYGLVGTVRAAHPSREDLARARRGHLGNARRAQALHLFEDHGLGRVRPRHQVRRAVPPARAARSLAHAARGRSTRMSARTPGTRPSRPSRRATAATSSTPAC